MHYPFSYWSTRRTWPVERRRSTPFPSLLPLQTMPVEIYDVLSIGLGPAALSVSIALLEENAAIQSRRTHGTTDTYDRPDQQVFSSLGGLQDALKREENHHGSASKDAFRRAKNLASEGGAGLKERELSFYSIEAHSTFKWHPGMMLDGSRMQIS